MGLPTVHCVMWPVCLGHPEPSPLSPRPPSARRGRLASGIPGNNRPQRQHTSGNLASPTSHLHPHPPRECFNTAILLGSIDAPLLPAAACRPQDISESGESRITACLCSSDLCNSNSGAAGLGGPEEGPAREVQRLEPQKFQDSRQEPQRNQEQRNEVEKNDAKRNEIRRDQVQSRNEVERNEVRRNEVERESLRRAEPERLAAGLQEPSGGAGLPSGGAGLQCFSCGSLLNPDAVCDQFDPTDPSQVQTCGAGEACMMYSWSKSDTETATLRECFPTSVLLGSINNPLLATQGCQQRDITDDGSGTILACLCTRDFCNHDSPGLQPLASRAPPTRPPPTRAPQTRAPQTRAPQTRAPQTRAPQIFTRAPQAVTRAPQQVTRAPQRTVSRAPQKSRVPTLPSEAPRAGCPDGFELSVGQCYHISR